MKVVHSILPFAGEDGFFMSEVLSGIAIVRMP